MGLQLRLYGKIFWDCVSLLCSMMPTQWLDIGYSGGIYTTEMGKWYEQSFGLVFTFISHQKVLRLADSLHITTELPEYSCSLPISHSGKGPSGTQIRVATGAGYRDGLEGRRKKRTDTSAQLLLSLPPPSLLPPALSTSYPPSFPSGFHHLLSIPFIKYLQSFSVRHRPGLQEKTSARETTVFSIWK